MVVAVTSAMETVDDSSSEEHKKYEFYLTHLQTMVSDIPKKYQKKVTPELCSSLAQCLSNDINFEIIKGLMDIQHVTEKYLYNLRMKVIGKQQGEIIKALECKPTTQHDTIRAAMTLKHRKQLVDVDMKLVKQLDQKVAEQQETLEKAGFPGFFVTTNSAEIKVQIFLLDFILRLSKLSYPNS